jgi:hypothetical protein
MRFCRLFLIAGVLSTSFSTVWAEEGSESKPLPPEKVQIIHENLLAPEGDAFRLPGTKDQALSQGAQSTSVPETSDEKMTAQGVAGILKGQNITLQGKPGHWQFVHEEMQIFLLVDSEGNRVRLVTPLARLDLLRQDPDFIEVNLLRKLLKANYLPTGDVRLCLNRHIVWAAFLHPLDTLTERDLLSALAQLVRVARETRRDES